MSSEWKIERNLCRCCHSEGTFRTMGVPCYDQGHLEVFSEMIQETFDIGMTPVAGPLCMVTYTICEVCILKLRDAHSFKKQVIKCEERFRDMYRRNYIKVDIDIEVKEEHAYPEEIKVETYQEQQDQLGMDDHHNYEDDPGDCTIILEGDNSEPELSIKQELDNKKTKGKAKSAAKTKKVPKAARTKKKASVPSEEAEKTPDEGASKPKKKKGSIYHLQKEDYRIEHGKHICNHCNKTLASEYNLKIHVNVIHRKPSKKRMFKCKVKSGETYCENEFKSYSALATHMLKAHDIDTRIECKACDVKFTCKKSIRAHMNNIHMLGEKFKCDMCEYETRIKDQLNRHKVIHKRTRDHPCSFCKKSFMRKCNLEQHEKIHKADKTKVCAECGKAFVQKASLNYHMTKYHPEVNF